jgi:hypothetical protein
MASALLIGSQQCLPAAGRLRPYGERQIALEGEEILEELLAGLGQDGLWVELHAF